MVVVRGDLVGAGCTLQLMLLKLKIWDDVLVLSLLAIINYIVIVDIFERL